jgi:FPC/CPF motif-containing protein YcgG
MLASPKHELAVLEIHRANELKSPEAAGVFLRDILLGLRSRDLSENRDLTDGIDDPGWDFDFFGEPFFVSFFAPLYAPDHSRFSGEPDIAFILFQPERVFRRFRVSSKRPDRGALSKRVHRTFARSGQHYDLAMATRVPKVLRYVKPLEGEEPIRWWTQPD